MMCAAWQDHRWGGRRFLHAGKHPTNGHFHRYATTCELCGKEVLETEWITMSAAAYGTTIGSTAETKEQ